MRILIADDHSLFREGLHSLLEARGIEVVAEAQDGNEAVELAHLYRPDIVLMDVQMPGMGGLAATRHISAELPGVKVVVLTASEDDADLLEAVRSGAQGYLLKNLKAHQVSDLLEGVMRGEPALTPGLAGKLLGELARPPSTQHRQSPEALSEREHEILELMVEGVTSTRELAQALVVSEHTIKYHLSNILGKLHLQSRTQLVAYALREGLVA